METTSSLADGGLLRTGFWNRSSLAKGGMLRTGRSPAGCFEIAYMMITICGRTRSRAKVTKQL